MTITTSESAARTRRGVPTIWPIGPLRISDLMKFEGETRTDGAEPERAEDADGTRQRVSKR